jgi:hypothetical protein
MVSGGIIGRLRASCLSRWELGDLLGIHPHQLAHLGPGGLSARLSVEALIELSRRLVWSDSRTTVRRRHEYASAIRGRDLPVRVEPTDMPETTDGAVPFDLRGSSPARPSA